MAGRDAGKAGSGLRPDKQNGRVSASGGYPGQQPAQAAFVAVQPGSATLTALDTACLHAQPACEPAQQVWRVTVIVTGGYPAP